MANGKKPVQTKLESKTKAKSSGSGHWAARDVNSGRFVEIESSNGAFKSVRAERIATKFVSTSKTAALPPRRPGRMAGRFTVAPDAFDAMTDAEVREFYGE